VYDWILPNTASVHLPKLCASWITFFGVCFLIIKCGYLNFRVGKITYKYLSIVDTEDMEFFPGETRFSLTTSNLSENHSLATTSL